MLRGAPSKEVQALNEMPRYCPGCEGERLFEQYHAEPGGCPDAPDGQCQEWACTECGTALVVGFVLRQEAAGARSPSGTLA